MRLYTCLVSAVLAADPCSDLDRLLDLGAGSYSKGSVCHGLFWKVSRGVGPICFHSSKSGEDCPSKHAVYISEALAEYNRLKTLWDGVRQTTTTSLPGSEIAIDRAMDSLGNPTLLPWENPGAPVALDTFVSEKSQGGLELLVLGDVGYANELLRQTMATARRKLGSSVVDSAILLGDNFYPRGIITDISDPQFRDVFEEIVSKEFPGIDFHAILGNHDWLGNAEAELQYSSVSPRWKMPYYYYSRKFQAADGTSACIWFLDTEIIDVSRRAKHPYQASAQLQWLEETLAAASDTCDWKLVVGHHPIFDAGEYKDNKRMISKILPILEKNGVDMYLSGHEHEHLVLVHEAISPIHFVISGCTAERRSGQLNTTHPMLVFAEPRATAFLQLSISKKKLEYRIHKGSGDPSLDALYVGRIERSETSSTTEETIFEEDRVVSEEVSTSITEEIVLEENRIVPHEETKSTTEEIVFEENKIVSHDETSTTEEILFEENKIVPPVSEVEDEPDLFA